MFNNYIFFSFIQSIRYANNKINFLKSAEKSFPQIYLEDKFGKYFFPKCIDLLDGFIPLLHAFHTIITLHKVCMLANFFLLLPSMQKELCTHISTSNVRSQTAVCLRLFTTPGSEVSRRLQNTLNIACRRILAERACTKSSHNFYLRMRWKLLHTRRNP